MMKSSLIRINLIFILLVLFIPNPVSAETKTFIKEYTYQASVYESRGDCSILALAQLKRMLLEELGTYLESETEIKNFQLTRDRITAYTAGIVQTKVLKEEWDGERYWLQAEIKADPDEVVKAVDFLRKDRKKSKDLEYANKRTETALKEVEQLRRELEVTKRDQKKIVRFDMVMKELKATGWIEKGIRLEMADKHEDAIYAFSMAIQQNPNDSMAFNNRGWAYAQLGNYEQSVKDCNKAIELDPENATAYINRGSSYLKLGNYNQALEDCNKAIKLDSENVLAYSNRGAVYEKLRKYRNAIKDYDAAIKLDPLDSISYYNRGSAYGRVGDYAKSIKDLNKAIELNPADPTRYYNRAVAYHKSGRLNQALNDYRTAAKLGLEQAQDYLKSRGIEW